VWGLAAVAVVAAALSLESAQEAVEPDSVA